VGLVVIRGRPDEPEFLHDDILMLLLDGKDIVENNRMTWVTETAAQ
jgi:hypothetical protein